MSVKNYQEQNVYEAGLERIRYCFKNYDKICVSFSGGKDSTVVLNLALKVAKEQNKLPLDVIFFDEEILDNPTHEYAERVSERDDVNMHWLCLEWKHRNACSNEEPFWYCWDADKKDVWVREMPKQAITTHKRWTKGMSFQDFAHYYYDKEVGSVCFLTGVRTQESLRRLRVITSKHNDSYIQANATWNSVLAHPVYDWSSEDVWLGVQKFDWDYNKAYDVFNQTSLHSKFLQQRVCPPYGEEPIRRLWIWQECFPDLWDKMLKRVPGVSTAIRYSNTELYSNARVKPDNLTYQEYTKVIIESYASPYKEQVKKTLNKYIKLHYNKTDTKIEDEIANPLTGVSWKFLCRCAIRGDFKGRQASNLLNEAVKRRDKLNITLEEAQKLYLKK